MLSRLRCLSAFAACLLLAPFPSLAAEPAKEPGDLWETTTEMSMMGMSMPARTSRHCAPRNWTEPPGSSEDNAKSKCETVGFTANGSTYSWKMKCAGPPPMTGEGQVTRTADGYTGTMKMTMPQGEMVMNIKGRRLGDCDGGETKRQITKIQDQAAASQAQYKQLTCQTAIQAMQLSQISGATPSCTDPGAKAQYCDRLRTEEGFRMVVGRSQMMPAEGIGPATAYCGTTADQIQADLCAGAAKSEDLDYLGAYCPGQAQAIAQRECAGRKYSEMTGSKYQGFCYRYAKDLLSGAPAEAAPQGRPKKVVKP